MIKYCPICEKRFRVNVHNQIACSPECAQKLQEMKRKDRRLEVLSHYGGIPPQCACCGERHLMFLTIDHIKGGGHKHRRELQSEENHINFYEWLVKNHFPKGYRVLCMNCNFAIGIYGRCPHDIDLEKFLR